VEIVLSIFDFAIEDFVDDGGGCLAFAELHHLPDEEIECPAFAGFVVGEQSVASVFKAAGEFYGDPVADSLGAAF
jgi:hypothetical protein